MTFVADCSIAIRFAELVVCSAPVEPDDQREDCATDCAPYGRLSLCRNPSP